MLICFVLSVTTHIVCHCRSDFVIRSYWTKLSLSLTSITVEFWLVAHRYHLSIGHCSIDNFHDLALCIGQKRVDTVNEIMCVPDRIIPPVECLNLCSLTCHVWIKTRETRKFSLRDYNIVDGWLSQYTCTTLLKIWLDILHKDSFLRAAKILVQNILACERMILCVFLVHKIEHYYCEIVVVTEFA